MANILPFQKTSGLKCNKCTALNLQCVQINPCSYIFPTKLRHDNIFPFNLWSFISSLVLGMPFHGAVYKTVWFIKSLSLL